MRKEISQTKLIATKMIKINLTSCLILSEFLTSVKVELVRATASDRELPNMHMAIRNLVPLTDKFWNL